MQCNVCAVRGDLDRYNRLLTTVQKPLITVHCESYFYALQESKVVTEQSIFVERTQH